jgi:hypothetical protein
MAVKRGRDSRLLAAFLIVGAVTLFCATWNPRVVQEDTEVKSPRWVQEEEARTREGTAQNLTKLDPCRKYFNLFLLLSSHNKAWPSNTKLYKEVFF